MNLRVIIRSLFATVDWDDGKSRLSSAAHFAAGLGNGRPTNAWSLSDQHAAVLM